MANTSVIVIPEGKICDYVDGKFRNDTPEELLFTFKTCHNHIYVNDGLQKQPAFFELLKVIFCKIEDERNITKPLEFYATSEERSNYFGFDINP